MPPRGFDQGDLVMATLRYFRPRIVPEEGSHVLGRSVALDRDVAVANPQPHTNSIFCLLSLTPDATNTNGYPLDCYPFDCYLFDGYSFDGYPIKPNHPNHNRSIFCLLSLTPDATNTVRFCSGFIFSIRTRRHLVLTQPRGRGKSPSPQKTPSEPPRETASASVQAKLVWMMRSWSWYRPNEPTRHPARGRKEGTSPKLG